MLQHNYETILDHISKEANLTKEQVEEKVQIKLQEFNGLVSKEGAAHMVANELKIKLFTASSTPRTLKLREIQPKMSSLNTFAKIINIYGVRNYRTEKHEGRVASLFIGDETKTMRLTIWDETLIEQVQKLKEGDTVEIKNAYSRENNGYTELHLGSKAQLIVNPENISINIKQRELLSKKIKDVKPDEFVTLFGTIVQIFEPKYYFACPECNRKVMEQEGGYICQQHNIVIPKETPIVNIFFDDGTATLRTVCFRDQAEQIIGPIKDFEAIKKYALLKQLKITGKIVKNEMFNRLEMLTSTIEEPLPEHMIQELSTP